MQSATLDRTAALRQDFPILQRVLPNGSPLIYLDNAASSQKPESVIRAMDDYYRRYNANVHRGVHTLSEEATAAYRERTREGRPLHQRTQRAQDHLHERHHGEHQPGGLYLGPRQPAAGRRGAHHRDGAPRQHRALADRAGAAWLHPALRAGDRPRHARPGASAGAAHRAHQALQLCPCQQRRRHDQPGARVGGSGTCGGRQGAHRRRAERAAHAGGRAGARRRLLRLQQPQDVRADRHRRALRQA